MERREHRSYTGHLLGNTQCHLCRRRVYRYTGSARLEILSLPKSRLASARNALWKRRAFGAANSWMDLLAWGESFWKANLLLGVETPLDHKPRTSRPQKGFQNKKSGCQAIFHAGPRVIAGLTRLSEPYAGDKHLAIGSDRTESGDRKTGAWISALSATP